MRDLIDRQAAIDAADYTDYTGLAIEDVKKVTDEVVKELKKLPSVDAVPQWIPVTERLPDEEKRSYWVCTDSGYQYECRWTNNVFGLHESDNWGWSVFDTPQYSKVIAWMPLPKPYKAERKEG